MQITLASNRAAARSQGGLFRGHEQEAGLPRGRAILGPVQHSGQHVSTAHSALPVTLPKFQTFHVVLLGVPFCLDTSKATDRTI
eukprot:6205362-Pleurochrysis_carterae.AAC.3